MRKKIILYIFLIYIISCTNPNYQRDEIIKGIAISEDYYNEYSFIDYNTIKNIFQINNINFILSGLNEDNPKSRFANNIKNLAKRFKNKNFFYNIPLLNEKYYYDNSCKNQTIFFFDKNGKNTPINPYYRENLCNILINLITIKYDGTIKDYFNKYLEILDKGYIFAPTVSSEIIGPRWIIPNDLRIYIIKNKKESIQEAISKRRVYISFENNLVLNFKINNAKIGDIINSVSNSLSFSINIKSPNSKIGSVQLISNNNEIIFGEYNINKNEFLYNGNIESKKSFSYYFIKVQFNNGNIAFTTPIWVKREPLCIINNLTQKPLITKNTIQYGFNIENISSDMVTDLMVDVISSEKGIVKSKKINLKKREIFYYSDNYTYENDSPETLTFHCYKDNFSFYSKLDLDKKSKAISVLFDSAHNNIFRNDMIKLKDILAKNNFIVSENSDKKFFEIFDNLKKYHIILITIPEDIGDIMDQNMIFFVTINKYVYNGGIVVIACYNHEKTNATLIFLNEILRVTYSSVRFVMDNNFNISKIIDHRFNYLNNENIPVFYDIKQLSDSKIEKIYMRNPLEFFSQNGESITKLYNVESLVIFNDSTKVDSHLIKNHKDYASAIISNFGSGKVVILAGINFTDYDIDNFDNKKWILSLFNYISKNN